MNILIPCAGLGSRFLAAGYKDPKPMIQVLGKPLIEYSINSFNIEGQFIFITRDFGDDEFNERFSSLLKKLRPESKEIRIDYVTSGAAETALKAENLINNYDPLIIYNSDQFLRWNPTDFLDWIKHNDPQGAVVIYDSTDPKNSFAKINSDGVITNFAEKEVISRNALVGFHYWKNGNDFVKSAKSLMEHFHDHGSPECYISETYNYIQHADIKPYYIANHHYVPLGTPEDVKKFIGTTNEYMSDKPSTLFIDIDGTLLEHKHAISTVYETQPRLLEGVREKLDSWDSRGHTIILVTARKESARKLTEKHLQLLAIPYDQLIMGVTSGRRYVINDRLEDSPERAVGVNVLTDGGFANINWTALGL